MTYSHMSKSILIRLAIEYVHAHETLACCLYVILNRDLYMILNAHGLDALRQIPNGQEHTGRDNRISAPA